MRIWMKDIFWMQDAYWGEIYNKSASKESFIANLWMTSKYQHIPTLKHFDCQSHTLTTKGP
jgi:hypothetical protein